MILSAVALDFQEEWMGEGFGWKQRNWFMKYDIGNKM